MELKEMKDDADSTTLLVDEYSLHEEDWQILPEEWGDDPTDSDLRKVQKRIDDEL